jgi:hypothetical protein
MKFQKGRDWLRNGNWGLKLLSLALAIVVYYAIKTESARSRSNHDRTIFQSR